MVFWNKHGIDHYGIPCTIVFIQYMLKKLAFILNDFIRSQFSHAGVEPPKDLIRCCKMRAFPVVCRQIFHSIQCFFFVFHVLSITLFYWVKAAPNDYLTDSNWIMNRFIKFCQTVFPIHSKKKNTDSKDWFIRESILLAPNNMTNILTGKMFLMSVFKYLPQDNPKPHNQ